jgi:hypothetical protein
MRCTSLRPFLVGSALAAGCGSPPDLQKQLETVRSWTATTTLAADERRVDAISGRYARGLADAARTARAEAAQSLAAARPSAADRARADVALDSLDRAIGRLVASDPPR